MKPREELKKLTKDKLLNLYMKLRDEFCERNKTFVLNCENCDVLIEEDEDVFECALKGNTIILCSAECVTAWFCNEVTIDEDFIEANGKELTPSFITELEG